VNILSELIASPPQSDNWIRCDERLPDIEESVLAFTTDYPDPMVVPARYCENSEQWFDVEYVDNCGDQGTLYKVTHWMPRPQPPTNQEEG